MKAVGYVRVSTQGQADGGHSLAAQRRQIRAACEARGWQLVGVFADEDATGANTKRPGLESLLAALAGHQADVVIVTDLDRLSRNPRDLYGMMDGVFADNGAALYAVAQGMDTTTDMGRAMIGVAVVFARLERDLLSGRTKRGMAEALTQGHVAGAPPFGWRREGGRLVKIAGRMKRQGGHLVKDDDQQRELRKARRLRTRGATLRKIAGRMGWTLYATTYRLGYRRPAKANGRGRRAA